MSLPEAFIMLVISVIFLSVAFIAFKQFAIHLRTVNHSRQESLPVMAPLTFDFNYVREHIKPKPTVKFDPSDPEHVAALMMLLNPASAKLHPTLRFDFDTAVYDSAPQAMTADFIQHYAPPAARIAADTMYEEKSKVAIKVDLKGKVISKPKAKDKPKVERKVTAKKTIRAEKRDEARARPKPLKAVK